MKRHCALLLVCIILLSGCTGFEGQSASPGQQTSTPSVNYSSSYTNLGDCGWMDIYVYGMEDADFVRVTLVPRFEYEQSLTWTIVNQTKPEGRDFIGHVYGSEFPVGNETHEIVDGDTIIISAVGDRGERVLERHTFSKTGCR